MNMGPQVVAAETSAVFALLALIADPEACKVRLIELSEENTKASAAWKAAAEDRAIADSALIEAQREKSEAMTALEALRDGADALARDREQLAASKLGFSKDADAFSQKMADENRAMAEREQAADKKMHDAQRIEEAANQRMADAEAIRADYEGRLREIRAAAEAVRS